MEPLLTADMLKGKNVDAKLTAFFMKLNKNETPRLANCNIKKRFQETLRNSERVNDETYRLIFRHYINAGASSYTILDIFGETPRITHQDLHCIMSYESLKKRLINVIAPLLSSAQRAKLVTKLDLKLTRGENSWEITDEERVFMVNEAGANAVQKYLKYNSMHSALLTLKNLDAKTGRVIMRPMLDRYATSASYKEFLEAPSKELTTLQCAVAKRAVKSDYTYFITIPFHKTDMKFNHIMLKNLIKKYRYGKG